VSKRTLYNHFGSKDEVVAAYMQRRVDRLDRRLAARTEGAGEPMERLLAYVDEYCALSVEDGYRGGAYINAAAELEDDHPALAVIRGSLANIQLGLATILEDLGIEDSDGLAAQLLVVLEGALSIAGMQRSGKAWDIARPLVMALVEPQIPRS
jgi:AcrR family transcriptional regulator